MPVRPRHCCRAWFVFLLLFVLPAARSAAAAITGTVSGSVVDESGAAVAGATVTASAAAGAPRTVTTDERGRFTVPDLPLGTVTVRADFEHFTGTSTTVSLEPEAATRDLRIVLRTAGLAEEVVVTATRTATPTAELPAPVTLITSDTIQARSVNRVGDALLQVPGLYMQSPGFGQMYAGTGAGGFTFRGLNQQRTLVLLDGQPLQDGQNGNFNFRTAFMPEVSRIEVVPGAFSSLYGSNAIGGVINIITRQPDARGGSASLRRGFGDAASTRGTAYFQDRVGRFGVAAGGGYADNRSFVTDIVTRPVSVGAAGTPVTGARAGLNREGAVVYTVGDKNRSPWTETHASAKATYDLTTTTRLTAGVQYSSSDTGFTRFNSYLRDASGREITSGTLGIDGQRVTLTESNLVTSAPLREATTRTYGGAQGVIAGRVPVTFSAAYAGRANRFNTASTSATWQGGTGTATESPNDTADASLVATLPVGRALVAGVAWHREHLEREGYALSNWRDRLSRTARNTGATGTGSMVSGFAQQELALGPVALYAGGRVDHWASSGSYFQTTAPATDITYPTRTRTSFSPKVSAVYRPLEPLTLRASVGRSFRAPTNLDMYSTTVIAASQSSTGFLTTEGDPNMKPETGTGYEAGAEWRITPRFRFVGAYYLTQLTDLIYSSNVSSSLTRRLNAGKADVSGTELTGEARLTSWLTLTGHASWIASEIVENIADATSVGKRLTNSPPHLAGVEALIAWRRLTGALTVNNVGKAYALAANTDVVTGVPGSADPYTVAHAKVGYRIGRGLSATAAVNNLTNREYFVFYRMPGRNATLELQWGF